MTLADAINEQIEHLTDGGGVTSPDDMVNVDDVKTVVTDVCNHLRMPNSTLINNRINDYLSFLDMMNGTSIVLDIARFREFLIWIQAQLQMR